MDKKIRKNSQLLYDHTSKEGEEQIETRLTRDAEGRISLVCERRVRGDVESVRLPDLGRREGECLAFAKAVAESHTHPRVLLELWEEYCV